MRIKIIMLIFLFSFCLLNIFPQHYSSQKVGIEGVVTGTVVDEQREPLIGVSVYVKGTTTGVVTDLDGKYSIKVGANATLVFSYIGCKTREERVNDRRVINVTLEDEYYWGGDSGYNVYHTYKNPYLKDPVTPRKQPDMSDLITNEKGDGVGAFSEESFTAPDIYGKISDIQSIVKSRIDSTVRIKFRSEKTVPTGYELIYTNSTALEKVMTLPRLQKSYSQGYDGRWYGPDQKTPFSWGANMTDLEFDGATYNYDNKGKLVSRGLGNGTPAQTYDATSFFNTGFQTASNLTLKLPATSRAYYQISMRQNHHEGVIRGNNSNTYNVSLALKRLQLKKVTLTVSAAYNYSEGQLMSHGSNQASVLGAVYSTPVSFDNANGLKATQAVGNKSTWALHDGELRSYVPGIADNPYGLVAQSPDKDEVHQGVASVNMLYQHNKWKFGLIGDVDLQQDNRTIGNHPGYRRLSTGLNYARTQYRMATGANAIATWYDRDLSLYSRFGYHFNQDRLNTDYNINNSVSSSKYKNIRNVYEWLYGGDYYFDKISTKFRFANRHYFSNTAKEYSNWLPSGGFDLNVSRLLGMSSWQMPDISIRASILRSLKEAPLISGSELPITVLPVSQYEQFIPVENLFFHSGLRPEIFTDKSVELSVSYKGISLNGEYFQKDTEDFVSYKDGKLENVGGTRTTGWRIYGSYPIRINYDWTLDLKLDWYKSESKVQKLNFDEDFISLAGFNEVKTVFAKGKPIGAIYGTDFKRDAQGRSIIGKDGFPVKDAQLVMIGDPTPDWIMNFRPKVSWQRFELLLGFELKKGGDMWNGTEAYLDYLGRSETTGQQRNIKGYVFDGVTQSGAINTQPVNFYPGSVTENRWTRYGYDGVGTEYIQDASWLRLSELNLKYNTKLPSRYFKDLQVGFSIYNLFLLTRYKGVDPSSTLFNYSAGTGLDLFNSPGVRTYMFTVKMKISDVF